jgi:hypothetical protein
MRFLRKSWGSRVPGWALGLGGKGYHALMAVVSAEARARGFELCFEEGSVRLGKESQAPFELDLRSLAQACETLPRAAWDALVASRIDEAAAKKP